jgi:hypothetical protein
MLRSKTVASSLLPGALALIMLTACVGGEADGPQTPDEPWVAPPHPIQVDGDRFVDTRTGDEFPVRGVNYFSLVGRSGGFDDGFLSPAHFDAENVRIEFERLAEHGYTTVRIFLDLCAPGPACIADTGTKGLNPEYLDVIAETMQLAKETGLFLLFTSNDVPDGGGYSGLAEVATSPFFAGYRNTMFLTNAGADAGEKYWDDLLTGLTEREAAFDAVLGWSILNEQWVFSDQPPMSLDSGTVTGADGRSYDLSDPVAKRDLVTAGVTNFANSIARVIRRHDPDGLVTMGFFAPQFPNPTTIGGSWYVDTAPLLSTADLDFFDFHAYLGSDISIAEIAENFGMTGFDDKPVVMGEVGAFLDRYEDVETAAIQTQRFIADSCAVGFTGWLYWGYLRAPVAIGDATWSLTDADGHLLEALSPRRWPDPCEPNLSDPNLARSATASASRSLPEEPAAAAADGNPQTQWGAGTDAPQWIEFVLAEAATVSGIRLRVAQFPDGRTVHEIAVSVDGGPMSVVHVFDGTTAEGGVLQAAFGPVERVTSVRVTTRTIPSWVAWKEIEILAG